MRVVGMDVHVRNSFLHVTDVDGKLLGRGRVGNSLDQIGQLLGRLVEADKQPLRVVLESTTNSRAIHQLMLRYGREAGVDVDAKALDASKLRVIAQSVSKCDKLDAAVLNELARCNLKLPVSRGRLFLPTAYCFRRNEPTCHLGSPDRSQLAASNKQLTTGNSQLSTFNSQPSPPCPPLRLQDEPRELPLRSSLGC